jgi:uncharacterized protein YwqG
MQSLVLVLGRFGDKKNLSKERFCFELAVKNLLYISAMNFFDFFRKKKKIIPEATAHNRAVLPNGIVLSPELSAYESLILKTAIPFVRIEAKPADDLSITESSFGGNPYWPKDMNYPKDGEGNEMLLLAQLNFLEIPHLDGYPEKGILQFFVSADDLYGLNFDNRTDQTNFRVIYHEQFDEANAEQEFANLNDAGFEMVPISKAMRLSFLMQTDYVGSMDVRFQKNFGADVFSFAQRFGEKDDEVGEELCDNFPCNGHKIGGYATFTQEDPRKQNKEFEEWILLLQIDSQDNDIMWGDVGVANFFIHPDALRRRDFSNVMYTWDCT